MHFKREKEILFSQENTLYFCIGLVFDIDFAKWSIISALITRELFTSKFVDAVKKSHWIVYCMEMYSVLLLRCADCWLIAGAPDKLWVPVGVEQS